MTKKEAKIMRLKLDLIYAVESTIANAIAKKEQDDISQSYEKGMITPNEYLKIKNFYNN